ncbi:MAG: hypothetical protein DSZ02_10275 [Gammaproteobacteria bacterium]|nr:MAG: hypothetical protein DSZ02_10275 [Gammaproteobacteria bacterium]
MRKSDFLNGIAQRMSIPGGSFEFDLPQFHYWLHPVFVKIVVTFFTQPMLYCRVPRVNRRHAQD